MSSRSWWVLAVAVVACADASAPIARDAGPRVVASPPAPRPLAGGAPDAGAIARVPEDTQPCIATAEDRGGTAAPAPDELTLAAARFADLPSWPEDRHAEALPPFLASCQVLAAKKDDQAIGVDRHSGRARDWRAACAAAARVPAGDDRAARAFFEAELTPYAASGKDGVTGKFTAYFVQALRGSRTRQGAYQTPIWARPPDLVSVELSSFVADGRGRRVWGRLDPASGAVVPYLTRAQIRRGALAGKGLEILWVDDPVDALFADIEGSGRVVLDDGSEVWIEFAGKNGCTYRGVGKILKEMGELGAGGGTMQGIRAWLEAHPERFDEIADRNTSKVFWRISKRGGAVGSQGVLLTPSRSMAVDRAFVAASTPIWVDTRAAVAGARGSAPWRHLVIAQDTGGGILGPVRGDLYFGHGEIAADVSGRTGGPGRYWLLLPRGLSGNAAGLELRGARPHRPRRAGRSSR